MEIKEEVLLEIEKWGFEYHGIGRRGGKSSIIVKHNKCGNIWETTFPNFLKSVSKSKGETCPFCNGISKNKNIEECKEVAQKRGYNLLDDEYINASIKMNFFCNTCENTFSMKWNHFYNGGHGCPYCSGRIVHTTESCGIFAVENGYIIFGEYIRALNKMKFKHEACGFEFEMSWHAFYNGGHRCPKCAKRSKPSLEDINIICKEKGYEFLSPGYSLKEKLKFKHISCQNIFTTTWNSFQQGHGCPKCKRSLGERKIEDILNSFGMIKGEDYLPNYRFKECRDKQPLPFDFYFPKLNALCEYQGSQHYKLNSFWSEKMNLKDRKRKDKIKRNWAIKNGFHYLEIKYTEKDLMGVVANFISSIG